MLRHRSVLLLNAAIAGLLAGSPAYAGMHMTTQRPITVRAMGGQASHSSGISNIHVSQPTSIHTNINNSQKLDVNKPVTVNNNVNASQRLDVNKPVSTTSNVNSSTNVNINKPIE